MLIADLPIGKIACPKCSPIRRGEVYHNAGPSSEWELCDCDNGIIDDPWRGGDGMCSTGECEHVNPPHFDRLPVLGDALEEAGADPELVYHCRAGGLHTTSCWSLEAVLGSN